MNVPYFIEIKLKQGMPQPLFIVVLASENNNIA